MKVLLNVYVKVQMQKCGRLIEWDLISVTAIIYTETQSTLLIIQLSNEVATGHRFSPRLGPSGQGGPPRQGGDQGHGPGGDGPHRVGQLGGVEQDHGHVLHPGHDLRHQLVPGRHHGQQHRDL